VTSPIRVVDVFLTEGGARFEPRQQVPDRPADLAAVTTTPGADAIMLWDSAQELPASDFVAELLRGPCHVWHAGLRLGQGGRPVEWNACHGRAMLSCDVDADVESTSWKVSARALIARNEVLDELGGFDGSFDTSSGAALDAGLRWISHGALMRHVPRLLPPSTAVRADEPPTPADGIRIVRRRLGTKWAVWAIFRGLRTASMSWRSAAAGARTVREPLPRPSETYGLSAPDAAPDPDERVTVLVPTVGRYPYIEKLLVQLAAQTRPPDEVVVVDQNPEAERRDLAVVAPDLPLRVLHLLPPGQCTARNLGLQASTGTLILFLDDDDEVPNDLIERHLDVLSSPQVTVSCGLVDDAETGPAGPLLRFRKAGDTFPTNNAMIRRSVLATTGLFDPAYDRGARADHDLGMRSYLAGNLHVYDPRPQVFHHHAPMGGLRTHGARIRTRGNSTSTITRRHLRTATDLYLGYRYYPDEQVHEDLVLSVFASMFGGDTRMRRVVRMVVQAVLLPDTWSKSKAAARDGRELLAHRPEIPALGDP
jgi:glycosyltransferase involved in cell wall biosynthesis